MNGTNGNSDNVLQNVARVQKLKPDQSWLKNPTEEAVLENLLRMWNAKSKNVLVGILFYIF